ncbi:MAG: PQQ-dependent sugar dehydrogenase [Candidatus Thiothrix moscowensis]|nr:PQQ-dependent sugar dehydrogenase [Candidatus Thiothrix moscowensis]
MSHRYLPFHRWLLLSLWGLLFALPTSLLADVQAVPVVTGLQHPWGMVFLPDGEILISERSGRLRRIQHDKRLAAPVAGLPEIEEYGQGGLLGLALHPRFADNRWLYFAYAGNGEDGYSTHLARGQYQEGVLSNVQTLFAASPQTHAAQHFGGRIAFDRAGYVYLTLGDRGNADNAQNLANHAGSIIRLHDDGRIPADNPFVKTANARAEIWTYGHRNVQGIAMHPQTGDIWAGEHGPQGGDEINILRKGANYGWPVITYGEEYGGGIIGAGVTQQAGMEQPVLYWTPSIAPAGMTFYNGDKYPDWQGKLLVAALKFKLLAVITLDGNRYLNEERLLEGKIGRIRDIQQAPDGYLYVLTDEEDGGLYRLAVQD